MKKIYIIALGICWMMSYACNNKSEGVKVSESKISAGSSTGTADPNIFPLSIQKGGDFRSLDQIRVQALTIIDHRIKTEPEALSLITSAFWNPEFVFNANAMSKQDQYVGHWLKFEDDFSYSYGKYGKTDGNGKYHFRLDDQTLYMLDNDVEMEPKVWKVNHNADVIALVGTHEYGVNNGMQIKMIPMDKKPAK